MTDFTSYKGFRKPNRRVHSVFIHCSASSYDHHDNPETIDQWHKARGWSGIGYHYFISSTGEIFECRSIEKVPAAQRGHNRGSIAICCHGLKEDDFTPPQMEALKRLCLDLDNAYEGRLRFRGHCEVSNKSCPVFNYKKVLRLNKKGKIQGGVPTREKLDCAGSRTVNATRAVKDIARGAGVLSGLGAGVAGISEAVRPVNGVVSDFQNTITNSINLIKFFLDHWWIGVILFAVVIYWQMTRIEKARVEDEEKIGRLDNDMD